MATDIARLTVALEVQTAKYEKKLNQMNNRMKRFERTQRRAVDSIKKGFVLLGGSAVITKVVKNVAQAGIEFERLERTLKFATGSTEAATKEFGFLSRQANRLGIDLLEAGNAYTKLTAAAKGTALAGDNAREIFLGISEAATVLGLSADQTGGALTAIEQIISKGKVSAEELRGQLGERLPGAFQIAARSIGKTTAELDKMLRLGELTAEELLPSLAKELRATFGPEVANSANSAQQSINRFKNSLVTLQVAIAQSGLLDNVAALANHMARIFAPNIGQQIADIDSKIAHLKNNIENFGFLANESGLRNQIQLLEQQKDAILLAQGELIDPQPLNIFPIEKHVNTAIVALQKFRDQQQRIINAKKEFNAAFDVKLQLAGALETFDQASDSLDDFHSAQDRALKDAAANAKKVSDAGGTLGLTFTSALEDAIVAGKKLSDVLKGVLQDILRIAVRKSITEPLAGFFAGAFGGGRAAGGPVTGGVPYLVGERGPELFIPGATGAIVPSGGFGGTNLNFNIDARGTTSDVVPLIKAGVEQSVQLAVGKIYDLKSKGQF